MKNSKLIFIALASLMLFNCKEEKQMPKVTYENPTKTEVKTAPVDSSQISIADLPIQMEGTSYLMPPIGDYRV